MSGLRRVSRARYRGGRDVSILDQGVHGCRLQFFMEGSGTLTGVATECHPEDVVARQLPEHDDLTVDDQVVFDTEGPLVVRGLVEQGDEVVVLTGVVVWYGRTDLSKCVHGSYAHVTGVVADIGSIGPKEETR